MDADVGHNARKTSRKIDLSRIIDSFVYNGMSVDDVKVEKRNFDDDRT